MFGFQTTERQFELLPSVHFHDTLRKAAKNRKDAIVVFLDEDTPTHVQEIDVFNTAAASWRCRVGAGVHAVLLGEDARARFIAGDLQEIWSLPKAAVPPVAVRFVDSKPVAWISATGSSDPNAVHAHGVQRGKAKCEVGDGGGSNQAYYWSRQVLEDWGHQIHGSELVRDAPALAELTAHASRLAVGFYPRLCDTTGGDATTFYGALDLLGDALPSAVSTNMTLGMELCGDLKQQGGVCAVLAHGRGPKLTLPEHVSHSPAEIGSWLADITATSTTRGAKEEL